MNFRTQFLLTVSLCILFFPAQTRAQPDESGPSFPQPAWGRISHQPSGNILLEATSWPEDRKLPLPTPFPNIIAVSTIQNDRRLPLSWTFNQDATELHLDISNLPNAQLTPILLETAEETAQYPDGRIVFSPLDATINGAQAQLESHPGNHRIGFWTNPNDTVSWKYTPTRWGSYDVELTYSAAGGAAELEFEIAGQIFSLHRPATGSWYRYQTIPVGRFYLAETKPFEVRVGCKNLDGPAVMNLKAVTLRPAPEGDPVVQENTGAITLHARDAVTHSVTMRYEPQPEKNCLGFWVNPNDWAEWEFTVNEPGTFDLELWQGCGQGHGGSEVRVEAAGQSFTFIVEETGHFQIFLPRKLGRIHLPSAGKHRLAVKPRRKQGGAVMDIRQIRLLPVPPPQTDSDTLNSLLKSHRILFLGDSITYGGHYIDLIETYVRMNFPETAAEFLNLGLPSETVSGLSEPGHAGGAFPRPDLHERLGRILEKTKPDWIFVCYGMNDGIYHPFSEERFARFQEGMRQLREAAAAAGARLVHLTPPVFDPLPLRGRTLPSGLTEYRAPYEGYNEVLARYSHWLISQRVQGWDVIDIHGPMNRFLDQQRRNDPHFLLAPDGVHASQQGHWLIAREILRHLQAPEEIVSSETPERLLNSHPRGPALLEKIQQRQRLLKDSWLTEIGHLRPGMSSGRPLPETLKQATEFSIQIHQLAAIQFPGTRSRWFGFDRFDFEIAGKPILVVAPKRIAPGRPWTWLGEFSESKPDPDLALLGRGFHMVYLSAPDLFSSPEAPHWNEIYRELTEQFRLSKRAALIGLSHGGQHASDWAAANPDKIACIEPGAPEVIWSQTASPAARAWLRERGGGPLDADDRPLIRKLGTVDLDMVETTPVVFQDQLWRFEWVRQGLGQQYWANQRQTNYFRFLHPETGETTPPFADGHEFGSAFVHDGTIYVTGTKNRGEVNMFASTDLVHWESWPVIQPGRYGIFNTSICQAGAEFVLMFEIDKPAEETGAAFTARFAKSPDLRHWTLTPPECHYAKDRYTAPHALRWLDGWFYNFYLEAHHGYEMRVVRSRDLIHWEPSPLNPVLRHSPDDKLIANPKLDNAQRTRIAQAVNLNNSDIDFCEWQSRLLITYSWGNQQGLEHLAEAVYDGSLEQFLRGWFPTR